MEESLKELWVEAGKRHLPQEEIKEDQIKKSIHMKSKHVINKMKIKFLLSIVVTVVAIVTVVYFAFSLDNTLAHVLNAINILFLVVSTYLSIKAYIELGNSLKGNLKESLTRCYSKVKDILNYHNFLLTIMAGMMVLAFLFRKIMIGRFELNDPMAWMPYIVALLLIVPISYLVGKWNNRRNFGSYLNVLKKNIEGLE